jgi:hypothetical protein
MRLAFPSVGGRGAHDVRFRRLPVGPSGEDLSHPQYPGFDTASNAAKDPTYSIPYAASLRRMRHIGDFRKWKHHDAYSKAFARLMTDLQSDAAIPAVIH